MSTQNLGKVLNLFISIKGEISRLSKEEISLDEKGVKEDKFYSKDNLRAILITSSSSYTLAQSNNISMIKGDLGENIIVDCDIYHLKPQDRFKIGDIELEVTQNCTLCNGLSKINPKLPKLLKDGRGVFVKAVTSGCVKKDDNVYL